MSWRAQGMRTWILQRLTALYMLIYLLVFGVSLLSQPVHDFSNWRSHFSAVFPNIATLLFFFSLLFHAWVGVRDILIDYVHASSLRLLLWIIITLGLVMLAIWISMVLYSVVIL
jgi:succinate dehydrogenase / fumarate reductase membrane anchor subunit